MNQVTAEQKAQLLAPYGESTRERFWKFGKMTVLPKGQVCVRAKEENSNIYFIISGKVQIYNLTSCGRKKILFVLGPGQIVNESLTERNSSVFCEVLETCQFYVLRQETLWELMEQDFLFTKALLAYQEKKIWRLEHQLKNTIGSIYMERKLAAKLLKLVRDFGIPDERGWLIDLELSITFLADFLGAPRETTSRACRKLINCGLIVMERKRVWVCDKERLAAFYRTGSLKTEDVT